jgi:hypothetical protein
MHLFFLINGGGQMPQLAYTKTAIESAKRDPGGGQLVYWFSKELSGFGLLVSGKTHGRTFILQKDIAGRSRRLTIGAYVPGCDLAATRKKAGKWWDEMADGIDPKQQRRQEQAASVTVQSVLDDYIATKKKLRPASIRNYRGAVRRYLSDWTKLPIKSINADMVVAQHRKIRTNVTTDKYKSHAYDARKGDFTADYAMRVFGFLWNFAAATDLDMRSKNPTLALTVRDQWLVDKDNSRRETFIPLERLPAFYDAVCRLGNVHTRAFILLMMFSGLRLSTAAGLRWDEIDWDTFLNEVSIALAILSIVGAAEILSLACAARRPASPVQHRRSPSRQ